MSYSVSQKEKNTYRILMHIYGIYKNGTGELIGRAGIKIRRRGWTVDTAGEGEGGELGEQCVRSHMLNSQPVGSCCMVLGAQLRAL